MLRIALGILAAASALLLALLFQRAGPGDASVLAAAPRAPLAREDSPPPDLVAPLPRIGPVHARVVEAAPEPAAEEAPELLGPPPDPVGVGECALELSLVDRETGAPVLCKVRLWRLDAPPTEFWSRGDQLQVERIVSKDGSVFERLPEGQYRATCAAACFASPDPPPFLVRGERTLVRLEVDVARRRSAFLSLFDETGVPIDRARMRRSGTIFVSRTASEPDWVLRRMCNVEYPEPLPQGSGGGHFFSHNRWVDLVATEHRFELGEFPVDSREREQRSGVRVEVEGRSRVEFDVRGDVEGESVYVSVSVDRDWVLRHLVRPDGTTCEGSDVDVDIHATAELATESGEPEPWRHVPLSVAVRDERYEPLELELSLADGEPADRLLEIKRD